MKTKHISQTFLYLVSFIILFDSFLLSFDPAFYSVPLKNFSIKVYSEKTSRYRMLLADSEFILPETSTQKVLSNSRINNAYAVLVQTGDNDDLYAGKSETYEKYLSNSRLLNTDDPEILKLKPGFKDSKDIIEDVERFVYNHISNKTIGMPIISASDILKNKTGDCTEHTVLAVSILRALGIPARGLMGMLLSEEFHGNKNVFVFHMWAEAFMNGKWVLIDAANPGQKHANRYIAFAYHHLQTEIPLSYLKAVSAMKTFSVEYVK